MTIASDTLENRVEELLQKEEAMLMDKKVVWRRGSAEVIIGGICLELEQYGMPFYLSRN